MKRCTVDGGKTTLISKSEKLTVKRQCELLDVNRSGVYYEPVKPSEDTALREEHIKSRLDFWHTKFCWMGSRKLANKLREDDKIEGVGRKLIQRFMREMGIFAVYAKPNTSAPNKAHKKFPYLLRRKQIWLPNQVWAVDITYISLGKTHMYLTAIIDWYSRFVVGWALSDTLETAPVIEAMTAAFERYGEPSIVNSDQGSQFTSAEYTELLKSRGVAQSMDGKARWVDNVVIERWFRSLKQENIYINEYRNPRELRHGIGEYVRGYNDERPHESHKNRRPKQVYFGKFGQEQDERVA